MTIETIYIACLYLSRLLSVLCRFSLGNLRRHALLGRCKQALSTDGEERFSRNILEQINVNINLININLDIGSREALVGSRKGS